MIMSRAIVLASIAWLGASLGAGCAAEPLLKVGNAEERVRRPRPSAEYRSRLDVAPLPRPTSFGAPGFDEERLWGAENDWEPAVAIAPDTGVVHQLTTRYGPSGGGAPDPVVIHRRSLDGGATWEPEQRIFDAGDWQVDPIIEARAGGIVIAAWLHEWDTLVARSDDGGATWGAPVSLLDAGGPSYTDFPRLAVSPDGMDVYVAFNSGSSYVSASHDGGATFGPAQATGGGGGTWFHSGAEIAPNGDVLVAATVYTGGNSSTARVLRSTNGGASWSVATLDSSAAPPACALPGCPSIFLGPAMAIAIDDAGSIMVAYNAGDVAGQPQRLFARTSADGGATWSPAIEVSDAPIGAHHACPVLGAGATPGDFRVGWMDDRNGPVAWNAWLRRTTDGGATWEDEIRLSDRPDGAPYKTAAGFRHPYGDYWELEVDADDRTHVIWGEGDDYIGPGGTWYTRGAHAAIIACPADVNDDGAVGFDDLLAVLSTWGPCAACAEDVDGDGFVGFTDLLMVLSAWGPCPT